MHHSLLPSGFMDRLPPEASQEIQLVHALLSHFQRFGYDVVSPPLAEYAETMLAGLSDKTATRYMQVMDPLSGRMLALRADITGQIARIAATSLKDSPRPLRICYAGQRIAATPSALQAQRQSRQIGLEHIGSSDANAIAEMIGIACDSLAGMPLGTLTIDISYPPLLVMLLDSFPPAHHEAIRAAVGNKNTKTLKEMGAEIFASLLEDTDTLAHAASKLEQHHDQNISALAKTLRALDEALHMKGVAATLHVDLLETNENDYYSGIAFAVFSSSLGLELGHGGIYKIAAEDAVGFTFYPDAVLPHLPACQLAPLVAIPHTLCCAEAAAIHAQGYRTLYTDQENPAQLRKVGVNAIWRDGEMISVNDLK
jgi:ATP phosphoribosyltransferase regulatory subunit